MLITGLIFMYIFQCVVGYWIMRRVYQRAPFLIDILVMMSFVPFAGWVMIITLSHEAFDDRWKEKFLDKIFLIKK